MCMMRHTVEITREEKEDILWFHSYMNFPTWIGEYLGNNIPGGRQQPSFDVLEFHFE